MNIEMLKENVQRMKDLKKQKESEIESIKGNIIKSKNDFYKENENYETVVKRFAELDNLFSRESDTSLQTLNKQLLNIISKVFDKIISKKTTLDLEIDGKPLGLNNKGIGILHRIYGYYGRSDDETRLYNIDSLDTYIKILKNKDIVDKIKDVIFKKEKKEMLDVLHRYLTDWNSILDNPTEISINRRIITQNNSNTHHYHSDRERWDIRFKDINANKIKIIPKTDSDWRNGKYINYKYAKIKLDYGTSGEDIEIYNTKKPSDYSPYDLEDTYYNACQVWDILEKYVEELIESITTEQKNKMDLLQKIWNETSAYLMVEAI